jgi:hypothetical protein
VLMLFAQINNLLPYLGLRIDFLERVISHYLSVSIAS